MLVRRHLGSVVLGLICLAWPLAVEAQYTPDTPILPGPGFFSPSTIRGAFVIVPTLSVAEEFNDNVFLDNARRRSDFVTYASPGIRLVSETAGYRVSGGYYFTAEKYAREEQLDNLFHTQALFLDARYSATPLLTFTVSDVLSASDSTNASSAEGISTGRARSLSNNVSPAATWQLGPRTSLQLGASYTLERFEGSNARDSDVYRLGGSVNYDVTRRLKATLGYDAGYLDIERQTGTTTHTPRLGVTYQINPTLTATVTAGPTIVTGSEDRVTASGAASLVQQFPFGSATLRYDRSVAVAGGVGGPTENQAVGGVLRVVLERDLTLDFSPTYTIAKSVGNEGIDVKALTVVLRAGYQITPWLSALASYNFFRQRTETATTAAGIVVNDVDQNRVFLGLQFGYPIPQD